MSRTPWEGFGWLSFPVVDCQQTQENMEEKYGRGVEQVSTVRGAGDRSG